MGHMCFTPQLSVTLQSVRVYCHHILFLCLYVVWNMLKYIYIMVEYNILAGEHSGLALGVEAPRAFTLKVSFIFLMIPLNKSALAITAYYKWSDLVIYGHLLGFQGSSSQFHSCTCTDKIRLKRLSMFTAKKTKQKKN